MDEGHTRSAAGEALLLATGEGRVADAKRLLAEGAPVSFKDQFGRSLLHAATDFGHYSMALLLLDHGADADVRDMDDCSPLFRAVARCDFHVARLLLDRGADPQATCGVGITAPDMCSDAACAGLLANPEPVQRWYRRRHLALWRATG